MNSVFEQRCGLLMESLGLCQSQDITDVKRLTGGVASDIATVTFPGKTVCVKFALGKLKVNEDWFAPVHRGKAEFAWLQAAGQAVPESVPALYGWSQAQNGFAMEFISGPDVYLWKTALLAGKQHTGEAATVAQTLGRIHAASVEANFDRSAFHNTDDFESLRVEPYLRFTAQHNSDLAARIHKIADQLVESSVALVHGDVSPKNILFRHANAVILDAECATMGDPAFDVAFALNHLILKSIHLPDSSENLRTAALQLWDNYAPFIDWEKASQMEARVCALLPVLMLARIDGKSPIEYLSDESRHKVRHIARDLIARPVSQLQTILHSSNLHSPNLAINT